MSEPTHLRVLSPGLASLVVDGGRPRTRSLGVPVGGPADAFALALGNALVGNGDLAGGPPDTAALEITLSGPTLEAAGPVAGVLWGAPFELATDRQALRPGSTFTLEPGERLTIRGTARGARAYLCVRGGFQTPPILGSRTGLAPLKAGDLLPCRTGRIGRHFVAAGRPETGPLRVLPGAQASWFPPGEFLGTSATVTPAGNRMGIRLQGRPLTVPPREIASEPVCPGTVQVTRDGQCIVLGVDGQTIGGYPKVAQVIRADLDRLGQLRPGDTVTFLAVTPEEAQEADRARREALTRWCGRLAWVVGTAGDDAPCSAPPSRRQ